MERDALDAFEKIIFKKSYFSNHSTSNYYEVKKRFLLFMLPPLQTRTSGSSKVSKWDFKEMTSMK